MARLGVDQELDYILFSSPPVDLAKALEDDCNGVSFNRCNVLIFMISSITKKKKKHVWKYMWVKKCVEMRIMLLKKTKTYV